MTTIHLHATTSATPEQFTAALTEFGPGRSKLFDNSSDGYLQVHVQGTKYAEVTEGSSGIWERLHYDWSEPNHVVMVTTDSNVWDRNSGHTYTFTQQPDGTTTVDADVIRNGKNLRGRLLALVLSTVGKRVLERAMTNTIKAVEARSSAEQDT